MSGKRYAAAISIGTKPTLGPGPLTVEAFLLAGRGEYYGQEAALNFHVRLRDQQAFDTIDALRAQIAEDVRRVREIHG